MSLWLELNISRPGKKIKIKRPGRNSDSSAHSANCALLGICVASSAGAMMEIILVMKMVMVLTNALGKNLWKKKINDKC